MCRLVCAFRRFFTRSILEDDGYPHEHLSAHIRAIASLPGPTEGFVARWAGEDGHSEEQFIETPTMGLPASDTDNSLLLCPPSPNSYNMLRRALYLCLGAFRANPAGMLVELWAEADDISNDPMPPEEEPIGLTAGARRQIDSDTFVDGTITVRRYRYPELLAAM